MGWLIRESRLVISSKRIGVFREQIWDYYHVSGRHLSWRMNPSPYGVFVSEVMLQQTQVARVAVKYPKFITRFPDFSSLASASVGELLEIWQGMGYNRRVLWLQRSAQMILDDFSGKLPQTIAELIQLPGVGPNTAGSIAAFAYNVQAVFIETNIRRVYIHVFFNDQLDVDDREIMPLIKVTLDLKNPREWYYALMDYGASLVKSVPNPNRRSKHYARQSVFEGSNRQIRGEILRQLLTGPKSIEEFKIYDERFEENLKILAKEGFIQNIGGHFSVTN
jgi:A/G-specific adenine glycosylase